MYFPPHARATTTGTTGASGDSGEWQRRDPASLGLDPAALDQTSRFAIGNEVPWPEDLTSVNVSNDPPEYAEKLGPMRPRGGPAGLILKDGYIVHEWGDLSRVDLTYSATKSYLATVAGLAFDGGLIPDLDRPVIADIGDVEICETATGQRLEPFATGQNKKITWRHLLQQTSEWEGTLWDRPDTVDWNRSIDQGGSGDRDERRRPGEHWEYNDVRVNLCALALTALWKRPLPDVLRRAVMEPVGASETWEWHGYRNSTVEINGTQIESVAGGAHWGGGIHVNTYDHARFGLLFLNGGVWNGMRLISGRWLKMMREPCPQNGRYGLMWWLNTGGERYGTSVPESLFAASGAGGNTVNIDPQHGLVIVTRWCGDVPGVVQRAVAAVR
ncbi:MAG: serine hydrolase [Chloroflexi bacterium]|nr:serine hydrolase [Chloroflexota bacterium]